MNTRNEIIGSLASAIAALAKTGPCAIDLNPEVEKALFILAGTIESCVKTGLAKEVLRAAKVLDG